MIGEAVPPRFTYLHGVAIRHALKREAASRLALDSAEASSRARRNLSTADRLIANNGPSAQREGSRPLQDLDRRAPKLASISS
jgi:hypothetical protein